MRLRAEEISFQYGRGKGRILDRISICVDEGERVGLTAPSGFGKTTLCRLLAGYERPDKGRVLLDDRPVETYKGRLPVQMIWQHPEQAVNPKKRMKDVLKEGDKVETRIIRELGIEEGWMMRFPGELSGGELQRFCIARALGERTRLLLADEITAMLDLITQSQIWNFILRETASRGIGLLVVSHNEELLQKTVSRRIEWDKNIEDG